MNGVRRAAHSSELLFDTLLILLHPNHSLTENLSSHQYCLVEKNLRIDDQVESSPVKMMVRDGMLSA